MPDQAGWDQPPLDPARVARMELIVSCVLALGLIVFGGVAVWLRGEKPPGDPLLALTAAVFTAGMVLASWLSWVWMSTGWIRKRTARIVADPQRVLAELHFQRWVISRAPLEGAAFFNLIAYLLSGPIWSLGLVFWLLVLLFVPFPQQTAFERWSQDVQRDLSQ